MSSKRDQLLDMAIELFFKDGCHATGIDKLLAQAGVAKMTLYSHFKSKEDLILAAADRLHERRVDELRTVLQDPARTPLERLHGFFDDLERTVSAPGFLGCPFHKMAMEFSDRGHPIHQQAAAHEQAVLEMVMKNLEELGVADPALLARQLAVIVQGASSLSLITTDLGYARAARAAAEQLLTSAMG